MRAVQHCSQNISNLFKILIDNRIVFSQKKCFPGTARCTSFRLGNADPDYFGNEIQEMLCVLTQALQVLLLSCVRRMIPTSTSPDSAWAVCVCASTSRANLTRTFITASLTFISAQGEKSRLLTSSLS